MLLARLVWAETRSRWPPELLTSQCATGAAYATPTLLAQRSSGFVRTLGTKPRRSAAPRTLSDRLANRPEPGLNPPSLIVYRTRTAWSNQMSTLYEPNRH